MPKLISVLLALFLFGCSQSSDPIPTGLLPDRGHRELRGLEYHADSLLAREDAFFWAQQLYSDYFRSRDEHIPATVSGLPNSGCSFPKPSENADVRHVHVSQGMQPLPLWHFSKEQLSKRATTLVEAYVQTQGKLPVMAKYTVGDSYSLVNVAVMPTERPVFLILTAQSDVIWSLQLAPGANIEQLVMIAPQHHGLVHAPSDLPVHAVSGRSLSRCNIVPVRTPQETWSFVRNVEEFGTGKEALVRNRSMARAYGKFLRDSFSLTSMRDIEAYGISNVLIGNMPPTEEARIPFKTLEGAAVFVSQDDYVFALSRSDFRAKSEAMVWETAQSAAGGDLNNLLGSTN